MPSSNYITLAIWIIVGAVIWWSAWIYKRLRHDAFEVSGEDVFEFIRR